MFFHYGADGLTGFSLNGVEYLYKKNIQNDIIGIYSTEGTQIAKYEYDAWGNQIVKYCKDGKFVDIEENFQYNDTSITNRFIAFKNPFRYRSYYYDFETNLYYLNSRYYDPQLGRFINADDISNLSAKEINGLNLYAYSVNNPVNLSDDCGHAWWHWLIGALVVIALAVATVVTAGGFAAAAAAMVGVMSGMGAGSLGLSILAGATMMATATFGAFGIMAGIETIKTGDINTFWNYGEAAMWGTIGSGIAGGLIGYSGYKSTNTFTGNKTPGKSTPYADYKNTKGQTITHYNGRGEMWWSKHLTDHGFANHSAPHWHFEGLLPGQHSQNYNNFFKFAWVFIKRLFGG